MSPSSTISNKDVRSDDVTSAVVDQNEQFEFQNNCAIGCEPISWPLGAQCSGQLLLVAVIYRYYFGPHTNYLGL